MLEPTLLENLRHAVAQVGGDSPGENHGRFSTGHDGLDAELSGGFAAGCLHELFAGSDDAPTATGLAAMLALRLGGGLLWLRTDAAERALGHLYMPGLVELGGDPGIVVMISLPDDKSLLKAAADAAACAGLAVVIVECWGAMPMLDLTSSRRLALAAERSGVTPLLLRFDADPQPSAAATRWRVSASPSTVMAPDAPGHSMIELELLRRRGGPAGMCWRLEWFRDERVFRRPALSGAVVPLSGDRSAGSSRRQDRRQA